MDASVDGVDFISSMPDEILHHILSFIIIKLAIRTSALSRRWRHVWCKTPTLDFALTTVREVNQTLGSYRALKITSFCLSMCYVPETQIDSWMEFAVSRNVEKLSLVFDGNCKRNHCFPNFFYISSSLEQLNIDCDMLIPAGCTVSWKSLRKLTLSNCNLSDESIANILSGSPVLETLRLISCNFGLERLDLSKSHSLRRLEIGNYSRRRGPNEIVAPHIHYLYFDYCFYRRSYDDYASCTLVDVSSLAEARIEIHVDKYRHMKDYYLQTTVLEMLANLQNVKRLTFNVTVLQILSVAELLGVLFPTLKVQTLTIRTRFVRSVIPGIARLLQNSPELKMLIAQETAQFYIIDIYWDKHLNKYLDSQDLNWRSKYAVFSTSIDYSRMLYCKDAMLYCKDAMLKLLASFMEMVMINGKTLETLVVGLEYLDESAKKIWFEALNQMTPTISTNNNVSIVFKG